jgi:hypothetical protein
MEATQPNTGTEPRPLLRTALLLIGDTISFLVFASIGRRSHSESGTLADVAITAAPFMLAWLMVAPWCGALQGDLLTEPRKLLSRTTVAWLIAWPIGLGLRALLLQREIPGSFALVVGITNTILLLSWRGVAAWLVTSRAKVTRDT